VRIEPRQLRIGDVPISYQVVGTGKPVVLVHGLSGSSRWWARNVAALAERFRVYIVDLIGFGSSHHGHDFVLGEAADYLALWMDRLELERTSLIGHSMGGFISADLAANRPDRVERLVLVDAVALPFERSHAQHLLGLLQGLRRLPVGFLPILLTDAYRAGPITILKAARELLATDIRAKLARIHAPTLVLWGANDAVVPLALGRRLADALPNAGLVVIKDAGHNPMWDRAEAFNRVVLDFLGARRSCEARLEALDACAQRS
jgi:pimeloyl-ACP methyl ester carboxylesterase